MTLPGKAKKGLWIAAAALALFGALRAFEPTPVLVDVAAVRRAELRVTADEDGRTRVRERYTVSAPIQGRLLRTPLRAGSPVRAGETVVAEFAAVTPNLLDARSRAEAAARLSGAEARVQEADAMREQARADLELARAERVRVRRLRQREIQPQSALDQAERNAARAQEALRAAEFSVQVARFELDAARASLREPATEPHGAVPPPLADSEAGSAVQPPDAVAGAPAPLQLRAPIDGRVLRVHEESSRALAAGAPILELGNTGALEVVAEYLSQEAVKIRPGMAAVLEGWGGEDLPEGPSVLRGRVRLVEPGGFTKVSALGVEEQRVNVIVDPEGDPQLWEALGDGYRVELRIALWEAPDVLQLPTGALFRDGEAWAVFVDAGGVAALRHVELGRRSGLAAEVLSGVQDGERVVLYPSELIVEGAPLEARLP